MMESVNVTFHIPPYTKNSSFSEYPEWKINATFDIHLYTISQLGPQRRQLAIIIPLTLLYSIIFLTGVFGNLSTCIIIAANRYLRTTTNLYLVNLAVADLLVLLFGLPIEIFTFWYSYPWTLGAAACQLRVMLVEGTIYASILTITSFTVERYLAICHPMRAQITSGLKRAAKVICFIWVVSLLCTMPFVLHYGVYPLKDPAGRPIPNTQTCQPRPGTNTRGLFEVSAFIFFVIPMAIITTLYSLIGLAIRRSSQHCRRHSGPPRRPSSDSSRRQQTYFDKRRLSSQHTLSDDSRRITTLSARRAALKMLVAVVIAFFFCWAPFHTQRLLIAYHRPTTLSKFEEYLFSVMFYLSGILTYVSTTVNPILYNVMSIKFRTAFKLTLLRPCRWFRIQIFKGKNQSSSDSRLHSHKVMNVAGRLSCSMMAPPDLVASHLRRPSNHGGLLAPDACRIPCRGELAVDHRSVNNSSAIHRHRNSVFETPTAV